MENINNNHHFSGYTLNVRCRQLLSPDGAPIPLNARAFDILVILVEKKGEVVTKAELMDRIWPDVIVDENNLNQAISGIRKALGDCKTDSRFIRTVPGFGYSFITEQHHLKLPPEKTYGESASEEASSGETSFGEAGNGQLPPANRKRSTIVPRYRPWTGVAMLVLLGLFVTLVDRLTTRVGNGVASDEPDLHAGMDSPSDTPFSPTLLDNSIALFPFTLLNTHPDGDLFVYRLNDELASQLSGIDSLNVISHNSVQAFIDRGHSISEVAKQLGVESVLTGTVMFVNDRAKVSLRMLDPARGVTLWASSYDTDTESLEELVSIQSDIALNAAMALEAEVDKQEEEDLLSLPTESFDAYRYNMAARTAYYASDFEKAWKLSKQAVALDSAYFDALYNFASTNTVLTGVPLPGMTTREHYTLAMEAVERMISVRPRRTEGYALKAAIHSTNREWDSVARAIEKLNAVGASLTDKRFLGSVYICLGDFQAGIEILEANLRVEPVDLYARGFLMMANELSGKRLRARREYDLGEELASNWWGDSVNIFLALGRDEPLQDINEIYGISPALKSTLHDLNAGKLDRVREDLLQVANSGRVSGAESLYYSAIAAYLGQHDQALELFRIAVQDAWLKMHWIWLPVFDEVRELAGFKELLEESGLTDYWRRHGWPEVCQPQEDTFHCDWRAYP